MMGTHWEQLGGKHILSPCPKEKKLDHHECMPSLLIGCTNFTSISNKLFVTIFGLG
jgi:hypothetical protein